MPHRSAEDSPTVARSAADTLRLHGPSFPDGLLLRQGLANGPDETGELAGNGRADFLLELALGLQKLIAPTQAFLGVPGDLLDVVRRVFGSLSTSTLSGSGLCKVIRCVCLRLSVTVLTPHLEVDRLAYLQRPKTTRQFHP